MCVFGLLKKYSLTFLAVIIIMPQLCAQQVPHFHHVFINPMIYNPSLTGFTPNTNAFFMRKQRYMSNEGGNIVNALTVDGGLWENKLGLGFSIFSDVFGNVSTTGGNIQASYKVRFSEKTYMGFGIAAGAQDLRINFNQAIVKDPNDPLLNNGVAARKINFNAAAGLFLQAKDFQLGFAVPQLLGSTVKLTQLLNDGTVIMGSSYTYARHFIAHARYDIKITDKPLLYVGPLAMAKYVPGAPIQYDGGIVVDLKNIGWISALYKANYAITPSIGFRIKKNLYIGYAYDLVLNSTKNLSGINQEILLGYSFAGTKEDTKIKKQLEEALAEQERLRMELAAKIKNLDSLSADYDKQRKEIMDRMDEMERIYNDSIAKLNALLAQKDKDLAEAKNKQGIEKTDKSNKNFDDSRIKQSKDDYFIELDDTDAPQGFYVVFGAYKDPARADEQFNKYKSDFPEARIIYNKRNGLRYVIFKYSTDKMPIFETHARAKDKGLQKAWILNYKR